MFLFTNVEFLVSGAKDSSQGLHNSYALCGVSLLTMTVIIVDLPQCGWGRVHTNCNFEAHIYHCSRLLGCYSCPCFMLCFRSSKNLLVRQSGPPLKIIISIASHTKIFHVFIQHHTNVQDHVQPQPCQANTLNMVQYRRTMYSVLWVQFALVALYVLYHLFR